MQQGEGTNPIMQLAANLRLSAPGLDHLIERTPRIAATLAIAMAWALTLAWPLPSAGSRPLVSSVDPVIAQSGYPSLILLPDARPVEMAELNQLARRHQAIAELELDPATRAANRAPDNSGSITSRFANAFAGFLDSDASNASANPSRSAKASALEPGEILALDYDLAKLSPSQPENATASGSQPRFNAQDGSLTVSKPLLVDGQSRGNATIRIEEGAQILISTASVADALGAQAEALPNRISSALATRTGFIPFHELRGAGIAVEYDPVTDRVSLTTRS